MILTVVRECHWTPDYIESLYLDDTDFFGLAHWYQDIKDRNDKLKEKL